jgi:hypothetical protein
MTVFLLLFPNGRLPSQRWRGELLLIGLAAAAYAIGTALKPGELSSEPITARNPFGLPAEWASLM